MKMLADIQQQQIFIDQTSYRSRSVASSSPADDEPGRAAGSKEAEEEAADQQNEFLYDSESVTALRHAEAEIEALEAISEEEALLKARLAQMDQAVVQVKSGILQPGGGQEVVVGGIDERSSKRMMALFDYMDTNGDGCIDREEFRKALQADRVLQQRLGSDGKSRVSGQHGWELESLQGWLNDTDEKSSMWQDPRTAQYTETVLHSHDLVEDMGLTAVQIDLLLECCHAHDSSGFGYIQAPLFARTLSQVAPGIFPEATQGLAGVLEDMQGDHGLGLLLPGSTRNSPDFVDFVSFAEAVRR